MNWLMVLCYCIVAYGACNVIAFGSGPFKIFERIRELALKIGPHFGQLFGCMMCLPTNFGLIASLVDWFFIPGVSFTPFNILLPAVPGMWALAMLCDASFTSGIVWLIHNIENWFEKGADKMESQTNYEEVLEDNIIYTDDITNHENERNREKGNNGAPRR